MGISAIAGISGVQPYYRSYDIPMKTPEEITAKEQPAEQILPVREPDNGSQTESPFIDTRSRSTDPESISLTFHKEETFDYIGSESKLDNLDVRKAISDMQKDAVLQEYQYFVGSAKSLINTEDGIVLMK